MSKVFFSFFSKSGHLAPWVGQDGHHHRARWPPLVQQVVGSIIFRVKPNADNIGALELPGTLARHIAYKILSGYFDVQSDCWPSVSILSQGRTYKLCEHLKGRPNVILQLFESCNCKIIFERPLMGAFSVTHPHNGMFTGLAILPYQQTVDDPSSRRVSLHRGVSLAMLISRTMHVVCSC